jgi:DNA-directed RNA polymerase subunit RPC12/RpoP
MREIKRCITPGCGREFETSPTGKTVRCHECRRAIREGTFRKATTPAAPKTVPAAGRTCTVRFAVGRGEPAIFVCDKPAVWAFVASTGEVFAECAEHH